MLDAKIIKFKKSVNISKNFMRDLTVLNSKKPRETSKRSIEKLPNIAFNVPKKVCGKGAM
ncbi:MAG: hypothetical protein EOM11_10355 [Erysipelotrichia bacterium]|nr:hypothetical protein [Erysipelotrichia bacterium]